LVLRNNVLVMTVIQTYVLENHKSLQAWGDGNEDRRWEVVYEPNEDWRELSKRNGRREIVDSSDKVTLKTRG